MPLVEWALTPMGHSWPKEAYASLIASIYPSGQSLLCDRRPLGAAAKAYKELFQLPKGGGTLKINFERPDRAEEEAPRD